MAKRRPESGPKPAGLPTRREVLGSGLGLAGLLAAGRWPQVATAGIHPPARAKNIIYIFLAGGVSQLDTFDPKPELARLDGQLCPDELYAGKRLAFIRSHPKVLGSPYTFKKHGQSGAEVSELMPHLAEVVDDLTFIKSMHCDEFNHGGDGPGVVALGGRHTLSPEFGTAIADHDALDLGPTHVDSDSNAHRVSPPIITCFSASR